MTTSRTTDRRDNRFKRLLEERPLPDWAYFFLRIWGGFLVVGGISGLLGAQGSSDTLWSFAYVLVAVVSGGFYLRDRRRRSSEDKPLPDWAWLLGRIWIGSTIIALLSQLFGTQGALDPLWLCGYLVVIVASAGLYIRQRRN